MISPLLTAQQPEPSLPASDLRQEAARYALMRRLAPALRHHLAGEFQPMSIMAALIERQLKQSGPSDPLVEHAVALGQLSRKAAARCMSLMSWLVPTAEASADLQTAVEECLQMVSTGLRLQGLHLFHHPHDRPLRVAASVTRTVLPAAVLHLGDSARGAGDLHLRVHKQSRKVLIDLELEASDRPVEPAPVASYRPIQWGDLQALAEAENVGLEALSKGLRLRLNAGT